MRKLTLPILPVLLAAVVTGAVFAAGQAHAQSRLTADQKDQEIRLLKAELQQLEQRVDTLQGLDQKVKVIDRKLEVQQEAQQQKALEIPIIKVSDEGFSLSSPQHDGGLSDYTIKFGGIIQGDGRFFTSGADKNVSSTFFLNRVR